MNSQTAQDIPESAQLVQLIITIAEKRDKEAFRQLFGLVSGRLMTYAIRCGANQPDAEEVVQEALLAVWNKAHTFNPAKAAATTWLYTIVRNKRIDLARKHKPGMVTSEDLWPEEGGEPLEDEVESDLNASLVRTIISTLPDEQRNIIYRVYFEGKSHSEIAEETGLPLGTIKSRLRLAMGKIDKLSKEQMTWLIIILLMNY